MEEILTEAEQETSVVESRLIVSPYSNIIEIFSWKDKELLIQQLNQSVENDLLQIIRVQFVND